MATDRETPKYTGIRTYRDPGGRFQFRYPADWHQHELVDQRDGVMFSPQAEDPETWFAAWAIRLPDKVVAEDADLLREGIEEGLSQLPGLHVESSVDDAFDNLLRFRRAYTYAEDGAIRKRVMWMLYAYKWQFVLMAQGPTADEFDHWSMMLNDCFDTFNLASELWFASDRQVAGDLA